MKKLKEEDHTSVHVGTGNVFEDLGFPNAQEMLAKAELVRQICKLVEKRNLTQAQIGELLGLPQPKVSQLLRGRLTGFSSDRLMRFLMKLECDIEIRIRPYRHTNRRHRTHVGQIAVISA